MDPLGDNRNGLVAIIGTAILFASLQFSVASVEMSSKYSVKNFSKDQTTLQHAADALTDYIYIGTLWTVGTSMMAWGSHGAVGCLITLSANVVIMGWIILSYLKTFKYACTTHSLCMPNMFATVSI
jgi:hypothetical protein